MSSQNAERESVTTSLGDVPSARSRHAGRRSTVALESDVAVVGTADGTVVGFDAESGDELWTSEASDASLVSAVAFDGAVVVGERGPEGEVRAHDAETGDVRWRYATVSEVGEPQKDTRFFLPFVADLVADDERVYAAARRYERGKDGSRDFESVVYAFDPDGEIAWSFETDGSPIALSTDGNRLAVGYNRCTGDHQDGLVVLDAASGAVEWTWDPGNDGQRRVGDVSVLDDGLAVTSHGDYRGYVLDEGGEVRWSADLATPQDIGDETLYAYPNHVHATDAGVLFVTGNTYPEEGRETESNHPDDHTVFGYSPDGEREWTVPAGGFVSGIGHGVQCASERSSGNGEEPRDADRVVVPVAQNFRERDASVHGYHVFDVAEGQLSDVAVDGISSAGALAGDRVAVVEEPVEYHDENERHGAYRVHLDSF
ncbi:PQQ-binding-like beta-propeller repeat protein [Haloarculaceae archaeon H-GB2-1]|nr:PQQ-binding-like beta-propeller repeat protein [Haloarculaceae archaeon H-GB1-1]MEA5386152.1 PQQ-binding-like beta-propeller repeat protein [Haloarculaceae archaeon H-GB11]MEA5407658.1 PQQ-binding-like beta-propeller repeat protein [Haloarculaceae archaeon H-GB2-1]